MTAHSNPGFNRRSFLAGTGASTLAVALSGCGQPSAAEGTSDTADLSTLDLASASWEQIGDLFPLTRDYVYMVSLLLASHPKPVQDEIDRISRAMNENPALYLREHYRSAHAATREACAAFLGARPEDVALTDSTTMSIGVIYGGLQLSADDDILSSTHDHNATYEALRLAGLRTGASYRRIPLYETGRNTSTKDIVDRVIKALEPNTKVVALTWVHSSSGAKLPVRAIADALAVANQRRAQPARLFIDGVHGFGVENFEIADLGCDAFMAGCHKWIWGPRGTGLAWGNDNAWELVQPTITAFESGVQDAFLYGGTPDDVPMAWRITPGGFHSFENRWALPKAFEMHQQIGRQRIADRIHEFTRHMVQELDKMPHVTLHTPLDESLQSGLACFEVEGFSNTETIRHLLDQGVIGSNTPYNPTLARLTPAVTNTEADVEQALKKVAEMKGQQA